MYASNIITESGVTTSLSNYFVGITKIVEMSFDKQLSDFISKISVKYDIPIMELQTLWNGEEVHSEDSISESESTVSEVPTCTKITDDGTRCKFAPLPGKKICATHNAKHRSAVSKTASSKTMRASKKLASAKPSDKVKCAGVTKKGSQCKKSATSGSKYCKMHISQAIQSEVSVKPTKTVKVSKKRKTKIVKKTSTPEKHSNTALIERKSEVKKNPITIIQDDEDEEKSQYFEEHANSSEGYIDDSPISREDEEKLELLEMKIRQSLTEEEITTLHEEEVESYNDCKEIDIELIGTNIRKIYGCQTEMTARMEDGNTVIDTDNYLPDMDDEDVMSYL